MPHEPKPYAHLPVEHFNEAVDALVKQAAKASQSMQKLLYGKEFVSKQDCDDLRTALDHALGDFLEITLNPRRDSMRYAPDGKGGYIR